MSHEFVAKNGIISQGNIVISGSITTTGGITVSGSIASASYALSASYASSSTSASYAVSSSYAYNSTLHNGTASAVFATTGSNNLVGDQHITSTTIANAFTSTASLYTDGGLQVTKDAYFSSSMFIKGNLTIYGTQSIAYITSSQLNIATNLITVNTATPAVRFGGLAVYDSGSTGTGMTGSLLWDSQNNSWIYDNPSGSGNYDSAMVIMGPRNASALGSEQGLSCNYLIQGHGHHHTTSSGIFHDGSTTCFPSTVTAGGNYLIPNGSSLYSSTSGNLVQPYITLVDGSGYLSINSSQTSDGSIRDIVFKQAGTEKARFDYRGYFGIGTSSPSYILDISGSAGRIKNSGGSADFILDRASTSAGATSQYLTNGTLKWYTGLRGLANDNFYVFNNATSTNTLILDASSNAATFACSVTAGTYLATSAGNELRLYNSPNNANIQLYNSAGSGASNFNVYDTSTSKVRLTIATDGTTGINTTTTAATFNIKELGISGAPLFRFYGNSSNGDYMRGAWYSNDTTTSLAVLNVNGTYNMEIGTIANMPFQFYTNNTERMRISSCGGVGIGVTPCVWYTAYQKGIMLASGATLFGYDGDSTINHLSANFLICAPVGNELRLGNGGATNLYQYNGSFTFRTAGYGTGGSAIAWCSAMYISCYGSVGINTTNLSTEANLFLGNQGSGAANEGGQLVLQKAYSCQCATHLDNYANTFRILVGTDTGTTGANMIIDHITRNACFYGRVSAGSPGADANYTEVFTAYYTSNFVESNAISTAVSSVASQSGFRFDVSNGGGSSARTTALTVTRSGTTVAGSLSKGSGSFRIKHPLASKKCTHQLVHSFIEGPQADLIYRGKASLAGGVACINMDCAARMTEGTFETLNRCVQVFTTNESSWGAVRGRVCGNILIIESQDNTSEDNISWMVIGERQDEHMYETDWTDSCGRVITEPEVQ